MSKQPVRRFAAIVAMGGASLVLTTPSAFADPPQTTGSGSYLNTQNEPNPSDITDLKITKALTGTPAAGTGTLSVVNHETGATYTVSINCYNQFNNSLSRATGTITSGTVYDTSQGQLVSGVGLAYTLTVYDNGKHDLVQVNHRDGAHPYDCTQQNTAIYEVVKGDFHIHH